MKCPILQCIVIESGFGKTQWPIAPDGGVLTDLKGTSAADRGVTVATDEDVTMDTDRAAFPVPLRYLTPDVLI